MKSTFFGIGKSLLTAGITFNLVFVPSSHAARISIASCINWLTPNSGTSDLEFLEALKTTPTKSLKPDDNVILRPNEGRKPTVIWGHIESRFEYDGHSMFVVRELDDRLNRIHILDAHLLEDKTYLVQHLSDEQKEALYKHAVKPTTVLFQPRVVADTLNTMTQKDPQMVAEYLRHRKLRQGYARALEIIAAAASWGGAIVLWSCEVGTHHHRNFFWNHQSNLTWTFSIVWLIDSLARGTGSPRVTAPLIGLALNVAEEVEFFGERISINGWRAGSGTDWIDLGSGMVGLAGSMLMGHLMEWNFERKWPAVESIAHPSALEK